jgi:hypothetical protein
LCCASRARLLGVPGNLQRRQQHALPRGDPCNHGLIQNFIVTIVGHGWEDFEERELPRLPAEGEPIETKYGTCLVTNAELLSDGDRYDGKIVCQIA